MSDTRVLTLDDIVAANDLGVVAEQVPEWGGTVYIRQLPADESLALFEKVKAAGETSGLFLLLAAVLVTESGQKLVTDDAHMERLKKKSPKVLIRLQKRALDLQGWTAAAQAETKNG